MGNVWFIDDGVISQSRSRDAQPLSLKGGKTELVIPEGVTKIENFTFYGKKHLTSIQLPQSLTEIGCSAFEDCEGLKGIELPAGVEVIQYGAFGLYTPIDAEIIVTSLDTRIETAREYAIRTGETWMLEDDWTPMNFTFAWE